MTEAYCVYAMRVFSYDDIVLDNNCQPTVAKATNEIIFEIYQQTKTNKKNYLEGTMNIISGRVNPANQHKKKIIIIECMSTIAEENTDCDNVLVGQNWV